ncbi:MAG: metalloendopeptidase [Actinomycetota bacterium]
MDVQRLAKVLALAASDNDTEALHALRTARRLLEGAGHDFVSLAEKLGSAPQADHSAEVDALENAVFDLRNEVRHLRAENERLRQGRPGAAPAQPASLADAAQDAAAVIRLRAELAAAAEALDAERAEAGRLAATLAEMASDLAEARTEAARALSRLEEGEPRRARLEVEVKRLSTLKSALQAELIEKENARKALEAELTAYRVRDQIAKPARPRRAKAAPAQQMPLL